MRRLPVSLQDVADAMESYGDDPDYYLDTVSGEVLPWIDPDISGEENQFDSEDERFVAIPRRESRDEYQEMDDFVGAIEEADVQTVLRRAMTGKGAFRRFREALADYGHLRALWERQKRDRSYREARLWLAELAIEPEEAPPSPAASPEKKEPEVRQEREAPIALVDMLLLGAPEGKTEPLEGRVLRRFVAASTDRARAVFTRLARELAEMHGLEWRARMAAADHFTIGRFELKRSEQTIELSVAVSRALWTAFAAGS